MKIFISGTYRADSFADNVFHTLKSMGHDVFGEESESNPLLWGATILAEVENKIWHQGLWGFEKKILARLKTIKPDLFLSVTHRYSPVFLEALKSLVNLRVLWWGDPLGEDKRLTLLSKSWSAVFLKDLVGVNKLRLVGRSCFLLDEAMNPAWHKPVSEQSNSSIIVAGNYYNYRQSLCEFLIEAGYQLDLYGPKSPRWSLPVIKQKHKGVYIVKEEKSRVFGAGLACLNSFNFYEGNSINCRAFEVAGAAGLQLIEYRDAIERCFEPGKELLTFKTKDELLSLIDRAQKEPKEMKKIREAGAKRALAQHTYQHRLTEILRIVAR